MIDEVEILIIRANLGIFGNGLQEAPAFALGDLVCYGLARNVT